ncbi:MAG: helix-turn-helix domain-containing protein [Chloroflexota bacterium]
MMIEKLLRLAAARGTARSSDLAQALGVSPALAQQMLEMLVREGYLNSVVQGCAIPCELCPLHPACLLTNRPRIWVLTEKGERFLKKTAA